jgi:hypothetical protein
MDAMIRAAMDEATGVQSKSRSESASENVGIQGPNLIYDCLRGAETRESQLQLVERFLELVVNSTDL